MTDTVHVEADDPSGISQLGYEVRSTPGGPIDDSATFISNGQLTFQPNSFFSVQWTVYMLFMAGALGILLTGLNPIRVTEAAMVFNAVALPLTLLPLLLVAGDERYACPPRQP